MEVAVIMKEREWEREIDGERERKQWDASNANRFVYEIPVFKWLAYLAQLYRTILIRVSDPIKAPSSSSSLSRTITVSTDTTASYPNQHDEMLLCHLFQLSEIRIVSSVCLLLIVIIRLLGWPSHPTRLSVIYTPGLSVGREDKGICSLIKCIDWLTPAVYYSQHFCFFFSISSSFFRLVSLAHSHIALVAYYQPDCQLSVKFFEEPWKDESGNRHTKKIIIMKA